MIETEAPTTGGIAGTTLLLYGSLASSAFAATEEG
jgi:hypothetical protein